VNEERSGGILMIRLILRYRSEWLSFELIPEKGEEQQAKEWEKEPANAQLAPIDS
jgi:hypothetical protein